MAKFMCGVPKERCTGGMTEVEHTLGKAVKSHNTSREAFQCKRHDLLAQGYAQIGGREFFRAGEPVLVLAKPSGYGGKLRHGKAGEKVHGKRMMGLSSYRKRKAAKRAVII